MNTTKFNEFVEQARDMDIDNVARLLAEVETLRASLKRTQQRFIDVRKKTGSSTPLSDFMKLLALMKSMGINSLMLDDLEFGDDDWLFVYTLFLSDDEIERIAADYSMETYANGND